jgi:hypothetical protein
MIHKPATQLEADLIAKDQLVIRAAEAAHHLASILASVNQSFWSIPTDRLLAVLNHNIAATLATFEANTALGTACNTHLDAIDLPQLSVRTPLTAGRSDIVFDGQQFVFVPPSDDEENEES